MDGDAVIATLQARPAELKQLGIECLYLFGSTARGDAGEVPLREGGSVRVRSFGATLAATPPPNPLPQGEGEYIYFGSSLP
jgi:hypothetical protein